jgi:hypothetical protein
MTTYEVEKTIKAIMFDGKQSSFFMWEAKFGAKGTKLGWFILLFGKDDEVHVTSITEENNPYLETQIDAQGNAVQVRIYTRTQMIAFTKENIAAFMELLLSIDTSTPSGCVAFDIVMGTKCLEFPNGNARIAMKRLRQKYAPTTAFALSTIYKKYAASKLRKGHDPDVFITYLQDLRMRMAEMNQVVDDKAFMLHILANLGKEK